MKGIKEYINNNSWDDYILESISIDYEKAVINISLDNKAIKINCNNFIGIEYLGQWDESVIGSISLYENDDFCNESRTIV